MDNKSILPLSFEIPCSAYQPEITECYPCKSCKLQYDIEMMLTILTIIGTSTTLYSSTVGSHIRYSSPDFITHSNI